IRSLIRRRAISLLSVLRYMAISPAILAAPFIDSLNDCRNAASRACRAAVDARFAKTNARILKTRPISEARLPKKLNICHWKDYGTSAQRFLHPIAILSRLRFNRRRIECQRLGILHQQFTVFHKILYNDAFQREDRLGVYDVKREVVGPVQADCDEVRAFAEFERPD